MKKISVSDGGEGWLEEHNTMSPTRFVAGMVLLMFLRHKSTDVVGEASKLCRKG